MEEEDVYFIPIAHHNPPIRCVFLCVCTRVCMCIYIPVHVIMCMHINKHINVYRYVFICTRVHILFMGENVHMHVENNDQCQVFLHLFCFVFNSLSLNLAPSRLFKIALGSLKEINA